MKCQRVWTESRRGRLSQRGARASLLCALAAFLAVPGGCRRAGPGDPAGPAPPAAAIFEDITARSGIHYTWSIRGQRPLNILQTIGNGCAFLDYDNDGSLDILLVGPKLALYKGDGKGHFTDVTHETGLDTLHGDFLGCAVGDYDNDGFDDIYLTAYRGGVLLHNEGIGHRVSGVGENASSSSHVEAPIENRKFPTPDTRHPVL